MNLENCESFVPWLLKEVEPILEIAGFRNVVMYDDYIRCSCPHGLIGKQFHHNKNLNNPAYQISITADGWIRGHCHSCQSDDEWDDVELLFLQLTHRAQYYPDELMLPNILKRLADAINACIEHHVEGYVTPPEKFGGSSFAYSPKEFAEYPMHLWNYYPSVLLFPDATHYLISRGLSEETIVEMDIRFGSFNPPYHHAKPIPYVGFPYKDALGRRAGIRWRCTLPDETYSEEATSKRGYKILKHTPYLDAKVQCNSSLVWYREDLLDESAPILIVEGQFDVAAILPFYKNVTCLFKNSASPQKLSVLQNVAGIIWLGDNDEDGQGDKGREKAKKYFDSVGVYYLDLHYPAKFNDAGEMPVELLEPLILNAVGSFSQGGVNY